MTEKLYNELSTKEKIKSNFRENSMLYKFYLWLKKLKGGLNIMEKNNCSYESKEGITINECEDFPVTYCKKCKSFYVLDKEGNREEISIKTEEYSE